ncbi:FAD-dependent oxidoreductase [Agromyces protaetiae]|uniref:FAD-dependent oxidoreductase n=1 Tax=Agromyces protaetiae TaxID=2509455 RepID=A0A4P6FFD8_9MICO|nr:FAD-dependent oxidoreductase [Agromyces protaetiae]
MSEASTPSVDPESSDPARLRIAAESAAIRKRPDPNGSADVVVIGGGVAGLVAALECAKIGLSVTVLERAEQPGDASAASNSQASRSTRAPSRSRRAAAPSPNSSSPSESQATTSSRRTRRALGSRCPTARAA